MNKWPKASPPRRRTEWRTLWEWFRNALALTCCACVLLALWQCVFGCALHLHYHAPSSTVSAEDSLLNNALEDLLNEQEQKEQ